MRLWAALLLLGLALAGCGGGGDEDGEPSGLQLLLSSELKDAEPLIERMERETGVDLRPEYIGSIAAAEGIASQTTRPAMAWLASDRYLTLLSADSIRKKATTVNTRMAVGVRDSAVGPLDAAGWDSWRQVAAAIVGGADFAMTDPATSNGGFSGLTLLRDAVASERELPELFRRQIVTAGSSGYLVDAFRRNPEAELIVSYESTLRQAVARDPSLGLTIITPTDSTVTATYPFMLIDPAQRGEYDKLAAWLDDAGHRREIATALSANAAAPAEAIPEAEFPATKANVEQLLGDYTDQYRRPGSTVYVLDHSGSMEGERLAQLKAAMGTLTDTGASGAARFARVRARERITLVPFTDVVNRPRSFEFAARGSTAAVSAELDASVQALNANGGTALYSATQAGLELARLEPGDRISTVVVLTDGEQTDGISLAELRASPAITTPPQLPVFTIVFGDADRGELQAIADATGGRVFDGSGDLSAAVREIRGYQ